MEDWVEKLDALFTRIILRLLSPGVMRLLAPVLAVGAFVVAWWLWQRAGRTALGRATRWWCVALAAGLLICGQVYLLTAPPDDSEAAAAARTLATERLGRPQYPASLAALGAIAVALSAVYAAWTWQSAQASNDERLARVHELRTMLQTMGDQARRIAPPVLAALGLAFGGLAIAGFVGANQIPDQRQAAATQGTLWVGTSAGVSRLRLTGGTRGEPAWEGLAWPRAPLPSNRVTGLATGAGGDLWIGTDRGLARLSSGPGREAWQTYSVADSALPHGRVLAVRTDTFGTAWVATARGAAAIRPGELGATFSDVNAPLLHLILDAAHVDTTGRVWWGGAGGVNVFQPRSADLLGEWPVGFTAYSTDRALPADLVFTITEDRRGRIWLGTVGGAAVFTPDSEGYGLGAFDSSRWQTFTKASSPLVHDKVHAIVEDLQGRIWFGTEGGISVLDESQPDGSPGRWRHFRAGPAVNAGTAPGQLPHPWVQSMLATPDGMVWAGTNGGGLASIDSRRLDDGWQVYRAHPVRRWTGLLWPAHWRTNILSNEISSLEWSPGDAPN